MHHFCKLFFLYIQVLLGGGGIPCIFICTYPIPSESTYRLKYEEYFEIYIDKDIHRYSKCTGGVKGSFIKLVPQLNSPYADYNFHVKNVKAVKTGGILEEIVGYEVTIEISKHILPLSHGFAQKKVDVKDAGIKLKGTWHIYNTRWTIMGTRKAMPTLFIFADNMYRDLQVPKTFSLHPITFR